LYGSAARGEHAGPYSDINLLIVVAHAEAAVLARLAPLIARWTKRGHRAPVMLVEDQIRRSQDVFPIELADIRDRHRLLHGDDAVLRSIEVRPDHLRRQLEFELRSKLTLFRQAYMEAAGRPRAVKELLARSVSSMAALFRGVLRLTGDRVPPSTPEVFRALESRARIDAEVWDIAWRLRRGERWPSELSADVLFDRLQAGLQAAIDLVDNFQAS
jgi:predicted nucleotidyltransferase